MNLKIFGASAFFVSAFIAVAMVAPASSLGKVLYQKTISEGVQLVMMQGDVVPTKYCVGFLPLKAAQQTSHIFSLSLELHVASQPPVQLWSRVRAIQGMEHYSEFHVLDLLALPDRVVMVMSEPGNGICLIDVKPFSQSSVAHLKPSAWSLVAAVLPDTPGRLGATLALNKETGRVEVEVTDSIDEARQHTLFEEKGGEWGFERIRQWNK